jgi:hypothetical protein
MNVVELSVLYVLVGAGWAVASGFRRRSFEALDAGLLLFFWPLYGPFLLIQQSEDVEVGAPGNDPFSDSLRRARGTPLADLLPDDADAEALAVRLEVAASKRDEIDALLAQPEFCAERAEARWAELRERGDERSATVALSKLQNIRRLRELRDRFCRELDEVSELMGQLRIHAEVVRIAGSLDEGARDLVTELVHRIEGLDAVLDDA